MPSYMTIWWIVAGVMIVVMLIIGRRFKNSTLDKLTLLPDEKILFEDEATKVIAQTGPQPTMFPRCLVRVTNQRIIIAQHTLFGGKSQRLPIRYVIYLNKKNEVAGYGGGALKTGYVVFTTSRSKIKAESYKEKQYIEITSDETAGPTTGIPHYVKIFTERGDEFLHALR